MNFLTRWIAVLLSLVLFVTAATAISSTKSTAQTKVESVMPTITLIRNERTSWGKHFVIDDPSANMRCISVLNDAANGGGAAVTCYGRSFSR
jgi:hypothetical protein